MSSTPTALVTGAAGALATAVVQRLQDAGWSVALVDRGDPRALEARYPGLHVRSVDLTDEAASHAALRELDAAVGGINLLVNVAGGFASTPAAELSIGDLRRQLDVNLVTMSVATTALLPAMLERGRGTVVGIAAGQAVDGGAKVAPYAASKAAVAAYLRSVDAELASSGVRTLVVYPMGTLDTPANREAMPDVDRAKWIDTGTLAGAIVDAVSLAPRARLKELKVWPAPT